MYNPSQIHFLKNHEIDKQRWDDCIAASPNGLVYARSFYLDNISSDWNALTGENYEWVLPITHRTKWGISYLYQPSFTQQLGVFSKPNVTVPYKQIIEFLQQHYRFCEVSWNYYLPYQFESENIEVKIAANFILNLNDNYETTFKNYHNDLIKNLKGSIKFYLDYQQTTDYNKCIMLYKKHYGSRMQHVKETDYQNFSNICKHAQQHNMLVCRQAVNKKEELMAEVLLLADNKRLYNIMNITTEEGRKANANHFLLDSIIQEFSGKDLILDFEGSDLPGVKSFYENFGGQNQPYYMVKYNLLSWPLRMFKK